MRPAANDEAVLPDHAVAAPELLTQTVDVAPGPPWEQRQAADLQARNRAPLPIEQLSYRIVRLSPWRLGQPSRLVVVYARADQARAGFVASTIVDGRSISVSFGSSAEQRRQRQELVRWSAAYAAVGVVAALALLQALSERSDAGTSLDQTSTTLGRAIESLDRSADVARIERTLKNEAGDAGRPSDVLRDWGWASSIRNKDAHVEAFHWSRGVIGLEVRGQANPFLATDRRMERGKEAVHEGVYLWAIWPHERAGTGVNRAP